MSAEYIIFIACYLVVFFYFSFFKMRLGLLSVYFFSMTLYFLPLFFMRVYDPLLREFVVPALANYVCALIAFLGIFPAILLERDRYFTLAGSFRVSNASNSVFVFISMLLCLFLLVSLIPSFIGSTNKQEIIESGGGRLLVLISLLPVAVYVAYVSKRRLMLFSLLIISAFVFLFGSRNVLVLIFIAMIVDLFYEKRIVLVAHYKLIFFGVIMLVFIVGSKTFYGAFVSGGFSGVKTWLLDFELINLLWGAEFLTTGAILNEVINAEFTVPLEVVPAGLLNLLPIPSDTFGYPSSIFNDLFQPVLFPEVNYGMAYSPWAESYSWLGYAGVLIYSVFFPALIVAVEKCWLKNRGNAIGAILLVIGSTIAFWMHRNSLGSIFAYVRNVLYPSLAIFIISIAVVSLLKRHKS